MTLHSVRRFEPFEIHTKLRTALGPGRPFMSRGCGLATDQKAVQTRGPGRVVLGSKPQLATAKELVSWAGEQAAACDYRKNSCAGLPTPSFLWLRNFIWHDYVEQ